MTIQDTVWILYDARKSGRWFHPYAIRLRAVAVSTMYRMECHINHSRKTSPSELVGVFASRGRAGDIPKRDRLAYVKGGSEQGERLSATNTALRSTVNIKTMPGSLDSDLYDGEYLRALSEYVID